MPRGDRNVLEVLKAELNFVTRGGYGRSPREPWREQLFFEDSPTCMNYDRKENPESCSECLLIDFVPADKRHERVPCRHIPLTADGEALLQLYRGETEFEIEEAMENWLRKTIDQLESSGKTETRPVLETNSSLRTSELRHAQGARSIWVVYPQGLVRYGVGEFVLPRELQSREAKPQSENEPERKDSEPAGSQICETNAHRRDSLRRAQRTSDG